MKKTIIILSVLSFIASGCGSKKDNTTFDLTTFPAEWRSLIDKNGEWVANDSPFTVLRINENELSEHECVRVDETGYEQTDWFSEIVKVYQNGDTIVFNLKDKTNGDKLVYKFIWINEETGVGEWIFAGERGAEAFIIREREAEKFEKKQTKIDESEMRNVTNTLSKDELKRLNTFLSNFAEAYLTNFDVNTVTPEELIGFGILHNWFNNWGRFVSVENPALFSDDYARYRIDVKYISESIKKYFDIDFKEHREVKMENEYVDYYYDGKFYYAGLGDGDPVSSTRIKEVYRNADGQLKITGEIGRTHDELEDEDIYASFVAYAKPYKYNGKDTWSIISFKSKSIQQ